MTANPQRQTALPMELDQSVEFAESADGLPVARVDDIVFAMVPCRGGGHLIASAWRIARPLYALVRADFYSHHGSVAGLSEFRAHVAEQAEHRRELHALARTPARIPCSTPWGASQAATAYLEGIVAHSTAGHGGIKLTAERNARVVPALRISSGWYEEDCEWAIVAFTFPEIFTAFERKCADRTICDHWPDAWEHLHKAVLAPGQSLEKDRRDFHRRYAENYIVISAIRSDHHSTMTEVIATIGGDRGPAQSERRFLVPSAEYTPGRFGFVIDTNRHAAYDGPSSFAGYGKGSAT